MDYAVTCTVPRRDVTDLLIQVRETISLDDRSPLAHTIQSLSSDCAHRHDKNSCLIARPDLESIHGKLSDENRANNDTWYTAVSLCVALFGGLIMLVRIRIEQAHREMYAEYTKTSQTNTSKRKIN